MSALSNRLNPDIEEWVVMAKEDFDTLQGENIALAEYINRQDKKKKRR